MRSVSFAQSLCSRLEVEARRLRALMLHMDVQMARGAWMRRSGYPPSAIRYPLLSYLSLHCSDTLISAQIGFAERRHDSRACLIAQGRDCFSAAALLLQRGQDLNVDPSRSG